MKFQTILIVGMVIELCFVPLLDAKRSFGITGRRNKGNKPSVRRNQQGHEFDDVPIPAAHPKPSAPDMKKSMSHSSPPAGPPPAYPGLSHHNAPAYGAPPAYSPSYASPPGYSSGMGGYSQPKYGQTPGAFGGYHQPSGFSQPGYSQFGSSPYGGVMPMGAMGGMGGMGGMGAMGGMGGMGGYGGYGRSSGMGSGIMTNLFAGLAGYQLARAFTGGHHHSRDREVIIVDNRQLPVNANPENVATGTSQSESQINMSNPSTEIPQEPMTQVGPAENEYNFYGIPQYGVPLYGYNLPSQMTDYYQTAIVSLPQPPADLTEQPASGK
jgi:hypothetical protein